MSTTPAVDAAVLRTFTDGFAGRVLQSSDDDYEGARRVHNGLIDRRPAVIAQCLGSVDVAAAVRFATANGLEISVRGGGHNVAGRSVCEGGLMIDLSQMRGVAVDSEARTASAQGGAIW
jgi:FAD/FMN-containing dehydrogenase